MKLGIKGSLGSNAQNHVKSRVHYCVRKTSAAVTHTYLFFASAPEKHQQVAEGPSIANIEQHVPRIPIHLSSILIPSLTTELLPRNLGSGGSPSSILRILPNRFTTSFHFFSSHNSGVGHKKTISVEASLHMPSDAVIGNDIPSLRNLPLALVSQCSSARRTRNSDRKEKEKASMFTN